MSEIIGMKVSELLELEMFRGAEVLSGSEGLESVITKINIMEVPDVINWLRPGEFLMTTAFSIKDDISILNKLIPEMKKIGVVGIGIKMRRYIEVLPESVIQTANNLDFPLIELPAAISYGDVITKVLSEIVNKQTEILKKINQFNKRLTDIMLRGGDLKEISEAIHNSLNLPVAIVEDVFKTYELSASNEFKMQVEPIIQGLLHKKEKFETKVFKKKNLIKMKDLINEVEISRIMIPINSEERNYGYVVIWDIENIITETTILIIEATTSLIALNLVKKLSVFENENKHRIEFIEELLSEDESKQLKAIEKAGYFEFDKNLGYGVVIVSINEASSTVKLTPNNNRYLQHLNSKLVSAVERLQRFNKGLIIYGNKSTQLIMLIGSDVEATEIECKTDILRICSELKNFTDTENLNGRISIGIGRRYRSYKDLFKSFREAKRAVQNIILNKKNSDILHYDELGIYRILSHEELQPELLQFHNEILGSLVEYDKDKDAELVQTLKVYFKCGCNLKRVSEEMFTHYNTVIYRLQRIKEIAKVDLNNPDTALNIHIALKISDILNPIMVI